MAANASPYRDVVETALFGHWLRTGFMADAEAVIDHIERKFNPYHAHDGKFTSPPGATVSYGSGGSSAGSPPRRTVAPTSSTRSSSEDLRSRSRPKDSPRSANGFRSTFVGNAVAPATSNADSYFELNKRQAHLDGLRRQAGPNSDPSVRADLDDFQRRLDSDRLRLGDRAKIADREVFELLRAAAAPVDIGAGLFNIARSQAELRDYLAVAGAAPIAGIVSKVGKLAKLGKIGNVAVESGEATGQSIVQLGGAHRVVKKLRGYHSHHLVAKKVSPLSSGEGPTIAMTPQHHKNTGSFGRGAKPEAYRNAQADFIAKGDFQGALQMDINDIRLKFGKLYDDAIEQAQTYSRKRGH